MMENVNKEDFVPAGERCAIARHRLTKHPPHRPEVVIDGSVICEFHYNQINIHGLEAARTMKPNAVLMAEVQRRHRRTIADRDQAEQVRKARRNQPGFVYYIRMDDLIKIGYAHDVSKRMRAYPPTAELLAVHPGTQQLEREVHCDFQAFLRRGREWFEPHPALMQKIHDIRIRFGDPSNLAYEYTKHA